MGCFFACFGSSKHKKQRTHNLQRNASNKVEQPTVSSVEDYSKTPLSPSIQIHDKTDEQQELSVAATRKKVTFDSNVKTYESVLPDEAADSPPKSKSEQVENEKTLSKSDHSKSSFSEDSSTTSTSSYPPNHRYQNCRDSDDEEDEVIDDWDSDLSDEECGDLGEDFEEANAAGDHVFDEEVESPIPTYESDMKLIGSKNPNARDRSVYVHPVLNPVENLTQWEAVKAQRTTPFRPHKENFVFPSHDSHKELSEINTPKKLKQEIPVDASLSNWLVSSETTPVNKAGLYAGTPDRNMSQGSNSVISHEDRPILGALTVEELKQFSATSSSPRKSPCRSPDEMPIIGTVGTFWNSSGSAGDFGSVSSFKGIPNTTSKYREDKKVSWHSTPFEARLEKALNRGAAEAASTVPHVF